MTRLRLATIAYAAMVCAVLRAEPALKLHRLNISSPAELKQFFRRESGGIPLVSAHRGGKMKGYPENCINTFEHLLENTHAIIEVDPRFTKDRKIVLMHDDTLERTTNGSGRVAAHALDEIRALRLKDAEGRRTSYSVPTLDDALQWAKGKTVLVIDMKDVPIETRVQSIVANNAEDAAIVMVYTTADAKKCYAMNQDIMMEVFLDTMDEVKAFDSAGVPWENVVVFVSHNLPLPREVVAAIHHRGAQCIMGTSRNFDAQFAQGRIDEGSLERSYSQLIGGGADLLEVDSAIEAGRALSKLRPAKSPKRRFYR